MFDSKDSTKQSVPEKLAQEAAGYRDIGNGLRECPMCKSVVMDAKGHAQYHYLHR